MKRIFTLEFLFISILCNGQIVKTDTILENNQDSTTSIIDLSAPVDTKELAMVLPEHDPKKAALFSAVIPGLGQAYNRKYWKIPLVWIGVGAFIYFIDYNNDQYQFYRKNLIYEIKQDPNFPNQTNLNDKSLKNARDQFRRTRDQLVLYGFLFYMLQIVDAHVDAHLIEFDVNQDLSVRAAPMAPINAPSTGTTIGLSLTLTF